MTLSVKCYLKKYNNLGKLIWIGLQRRPFWRGDMNMDTYKKEPSRGVQMYSRESKLIPRITLDNI